MNNICNYCGAIIPEGAEVCPKCGMPTVHAPHSDSKKFWEDEQSNSSTPPPFFGDDGPSGQQNFSNANSQPCDYTSSTSHKPIEPLKKNSVNKIVVVAATLLVLALIIVGFQMVKNATKPSLSPQNEHIANESQPTVSDSSIVVQEFSGEEADSIMNAQMEEMKKMEQMMEEMMGADPFEDFDNAQQEQPASSAARASKQGKGSTAGKIKLAGKVGADQYVMMLNVKDPNNITGTAATVVNGKERSHFRLLGIGSGKDLTISVYDQKNKIVGTLSGTYDGYVFSGVYTTDNNERQFQMVAQ